MKLQTEFTKSLELTETENKINAKRVAQGFEPYIKVCCAACGLLSPLASRDELAVGRWTVYGQTARTVRCPKDMAR
ncbi:MAG: hypothetical protein MOB07_31410 [Acidobacteria bacterium]|nr:hypothetical protein [Acidobacteriota bacterium]